MEGKIRKFRLLLCLIKHHVLRVYEEVKVQVHVLLTSAVGGGEILASTALSLGRELPVFFG
jgi:hypothetical protein